MEIISMTISVMNWLYIDADTLKENAAKNGYIAEIVAEGEHYDYLARITKMSER